MIISKETEPFDKELQSILDKSKAQIEEKSNAGFDFKKLSGTAFEKVVCDSLNETSSGTSFDNKFEQASTHAFPDLYSRVLENKWFGVEVKTSQKDWKCFGNSIFESTRIPNLDDRIYVFFGKFTNPLECKWARYEDCIDNINITHSPRYQINMDVDDEINPSVFKKMEVSYYDFQNSDIGIRMEALRSYKRKELGDDVALWWLPENEEPTAEDEGKLVIKLFSALDVDRKNRIRNQSLILFPELYHNRASYDRVLTWLASRHGVVTGSLRDIYSAGGKHTVSFKSKSFRLPRIYGHLEDEKDNIIDTLTKISSSELSYYWDMKVKEDLKWRLLTWMDQIEEYSSIDDFPLRKWLIELFK